MTSDLNNWELYLRHYDRDGVIKNGYIAPLVARYTNSLGVDEPLVFTLAQETYNEYAPIAEYDIIEVMIRNKFLGVANPSGGFVRDFVGIVRGKPNIQVGNDGIFYFEWRARESKHVLDWRTVGWYSGVPNRSGFATIPAETVCKTLVQYNATSSATVANGRLREGNLATAMSAPITIEADGAAGELISLSFFGGRLLGSLANACEVGGDYYTFTWDGGTAGGAHGYTFGWGRNTDKTTGGNAVTLSIGNRTLNNPRRTYSPAYATTAISMGQGEGILRAYDVVSGVDYAPDNDIETFVDARNSATQDGRVGQGIKRLKDSEAVSDFAFGVILTSDVFYSPVAVTGRKTYTVGDIINVNFGEVETRRIRAASVEWADNGSNDPFRVTIETEVFNV